MQPEASATSSCARLEALMSCTTPSTRAVLPSGPAIGTPRVKRNRVSPVGRMFSAFGDSKGWHAASASSTVRRTRAPVSRVGALPVDLARESPRPRRARTPGANSSRAAPFCEPTLEFPATQMRNLLGMGEQVFAFAHLDFRRPPFGDVLRHSAKYKRSSPCLSVIATAREWNTRTSTVRAEKNRHFVIERHALGSQVTSRSRPPRSRSSG